MGKIITKLVSSCRGGGEGMDRRKVISLLEKLGSPWRSYRGTVSYYLNSQSHSVCVPTSLFEKKSKCA